MMYALAFCGGMYLGAKLVIRSFKRQLPEAMDQVGQRAEADGYCEAMRRVSGWLSQASETQALYEELNGVPMTADEYRILIVDNIEQATGITTDNTSKEQS